MRSGRTPCSRWPTVRWLGQRLGWFFVFLALLFDLVSCGGGRAVDQRRLVLRPPDDKDPLVGPNDGSGQFTIPQRPIRRRLTDLPGFVVNRGGE